MYLARISILKRKSPKLMSSVTEPRSEKFVGKLLERLHWPVLHNRLSLLKTLHWRSRLKPCGRLMALLLGLNVIQWVVSGGYPVGIQWIVSTQFHSAETGDRDSLLENAITALVVRPLKFFSRRFEVWTRLVESKRTKCEPTEPTQHWIAGGNQVGGTNLGTTETMQRHLGIDMEKK